MEKISLKELNRNYNNYSGKQVEVYGWVRTIRDSKNFAFIEISDGTYFKTTQVVLDATYENYKTIISQNVGAGLKVQGEVVVTPVMKQPFEIRGTAVFVEGTSTPDYPLQKKTP